MSAGLLFVVLWTATVVIGLCWLCYAAHCYLTVLEQTAAGARRIDWPDEPIVDWLWKAVYLTWLAGVWLVPIYVIVRWLGLSPMGKLVLAGGLFFLVFPIGLLSALGANSRLAIVHWPLLRRLPLIWQRCLVFYLVTGLLLAGCGAMLLFTLGSWQAFHDMADPILPRLPGAPVSGRAWLIILPLASLVVTLTMLLHARLLGRLGYLLSQVSHDPADDEAEDEADPPLPAAVPEEVPTQLNGEVYRIAPADEPACPPPADELPRPKMAPPGTARQLPTLLDGSLAFLGQLQTWQVILWLAVPGSVLTAAVCMELLLWSRIQ